MACAAGTIGRPSGLPPTHYRHGHYCQVYCQRDDIRRQQAAVPDVTGRRFPRYQAVPGTGWQGVTGMDARFTSVRSAGHD